MESPSPSNTQSLPYGTIVAVLIWACSFSLIFVSFGLCFLCSYIRKGHKEKLTPGVVDNDNAESPNQTFENLELPSVACGNPQTLAARCQNLKPSEAVYDYPVVGQADSAPGHALYGSQIGMTDNVAYSSQSRHERQMPCHQNVAYSIVTANSMLKGGQ